jgi:hypothetical protein
LLVLADVLATLVLLGVDFAVADVLVMAVLLGWGSVGRLPERTGRFARPHSGATADLTKTTNLARGICRPAIRRRI